MIKKHVSQFYILLMKNMWLHLNGWRVTLTQLLVPFLFVFVLYVLQFMYTTPTSMLFLFYILDSNLYYSSNFFQLM